MLEIVSIWEALTAVPAIELNADTNEPGGRMGLFYHMCHWFP